MEFEVGSILEGKVTGITKFGAFVALDANTTGLVHISEVARIRITSLTSRDDRTNFISRGTPFRGGCVPPALHYTNTLVR